MAIRAEKVIGSGAASWRTLRCEDYLIIDGLMRVREREPLDRDLSRFVDRYIEHGETVEQSDLDLLNRRLRAIKAAEVHLTDTAPDSYTEQKGFGKANARHAIQRMLAGMPDRKRSESIMEYRAEAADKANGRSSGNGHQETKMPVGTVTAESIAVHGTGNQAFELEYRETVERVGRLVVHADSLAQAVVLADGLDRTSVHWTEEDDDGAMRLVGVRESR